MKVKVYFLKGIRISCTHIYLCFLVASFAKIFWYQHIFIILMFYLITTNKSHQYSKHLTFKKRLNLYIVVYIYYFFIKTPQSAAKHLSYTYIYRSNLLVLWSAMYLVIKASGCGHIYWSQWLCLMVIYRTVCYPRRCAPPGGMLLSVQGRKIHCRSWPSH